MTIEELSKCIDVKFEHMETKFDERLWIIGKSIDTLNNNINNVENKLDIIIKMNALRSTNSI